MKQEYEKEDDLCPTGRSSSFSYGQDGANVSCPTPILDDRLSSLYNRITENVFV